MEIEWELKLFIVMKNENLVAASLTGGSNGRSSVACGIFVAPSPSSHPTATGPG